MACHSCRLRTLHEGVADFAAAGMQVRIFDAKFAHLPPATVAVKLLGQGEVLAEDFALLVHGRRFGQWLAGGEGAGLVENPRIADRAAGDGDAVDARLGEHVEAVLRGE